MERSNKATREQLKRHNRQLILRAVYTGLANNRAALAQETGLAKPTVSDLVSELIDEGLLVEGEYGSSTDSGGKRPRLLDFVAEARQIIGVSVDTYQVSGVLSNLDGQIIAQHHADLNEAQGEDVITILQEVINGLIAQLDAPLLCLGIGVPGIVDHWAGIVRTSPYLGWHDLPLADRLCVHYDVPTYIGNNTELAAVARFAFSPETTARTLVMLLINRTIEVGMAFQGLVYHHGSDIGNLTLTGAPGETSSSGENRLDAFLGWAAVRQRAATLKQAYPTTKLPEHDLKYLHIRYYAAQGDPAALRLYDELSGHLSQVFAWVIGLLRPDHISLAGPMANLGEPLLNMAMEKTAGLLEPEVVRDITFSLADSPDLSPVGAVAQALQKELGIL